MNPKRLLPALAIIAASAAAISCSVGETSPTVVADQEAVDRFIERISQEQTELAAGALSGDGENKVPDSLVAKADRAEPLLGAVESFAR